MLFIKFWDIIIVEIIKIALIIIINIVSTAIILLNLFTILANII